MIDNLHTGDKARIGIINGIQKAARAVGITMGTGGSNSLIEAIERPGYLATNDGLTILDSMRFGNPMEELGRKILLEAVSRANKQSGDGSSTACVLTAAIITEGLKHIGKTSPMALKRSLDECISYIGTSIENQTRVISLEEVHSVATISAEDESIGRLIEEIYKKIGKEGIIQWDISKTSEDSYTIGNGISIFGSGYVSPYMCDLDEKTGQFTTSIRWKNPKVLITRQKITTAADFNDLAATLDAQQNKELIVFCDEYEPNVIGDFIKTRAVRGFKIAVIKMPVLWKAEWYEDLALASGATIVDPTNGGINLKGTKPQHLGKFGNIVVSKDETFIDGIEDLADHIQKLKDIGTEESLLRASRLNTKTARYFVGGHSESALAYKRLKVEDAISAAYQALNGGVVAGGGVALLNCANDLPETIGGNILKKALKSPILQIAENAKIRAKLRKCGGTIGYDSRTGKLVDMFEANIIDPAAIEFNACKNAISVAAAVLTADTVVLLPKEEGMAYTPRPPVIR